MQLYIRLHESTKHQVDCLHAVEFVMLVCKLKGQAIGPKQGHSLFVAKLLC